MNVGEEAKGQWVLTPSPNPLRGIINKPGKSGLKDPPTPVA